MTAEVIPELFGDRNDFAIEAYVESHLKPPSAVWGRMHVWCAGVALGDIDDPHCGLYPAYMSFKWLAKNIEGIWNETLEGLTDLDAWNLLDEALYGFHGDVECENNRTDEQISMDAQRYGEFNFLTNWGEQFDGCKSFLLCPPGKTIRVLYRKNSDPISVIISRRGFIDASMAFAEWFESEATRLGHGVG